MLLDEAISQVIDLFYASSILVHTDTWQGYAIKDKPEMEMHELLRVSFSAAIGTEDTDVLANQIKPNLPWANDHFRERVSGEPLNPGDQWKHWPWGQRADRSRVVPQFEGQMQFNHTYMERYWPKHAGQTGDGVMGSLTKVYAERPNSGIRGEYGDLNDVVSLLERDPLTRQAWLPIFHPEDTGVGDGGRKPCSLGYQFILRGDHLNVFYPLRSCDIYRHMRDDIYLTSLLVLWVLDELRRRDKNWANIKPGMLWMFMTSLHCFRNDWQILFGKANDET